MLENSKEDMKLNKSELKEENQVQEKQKKANLTFKFDLKAGDDEKKILMRPRSQTYLDAVNAIDLLSSNDEEIIERLKGKLDEDTLDEFKDMTKEDLLEEIMLSFKEELEKKEIKLERLNDPIHLETVIAECYIQGCDIHAIDKAGNILEHYSVKDKLSEKLEKARALYYKNTGCSCIEVYSNCFVVVGIDGTSKIYYEEDI